MKKRWIGYSLLAAVGVAFVALGILWNDFVVAFLFLFVLSLGVALLTAVLAFIIPLARDWIRALRGISWEDHLAKLEENGEAIREHYEVLGAATLEDLTTSCVLHLLDIGDGRILCLHGQSYYDYEPLSEDEEPELNRERTFPTRRFSLLRHKKKNTVLDIFPGTEVFEPELQAEIFDQRKLIDLGITIEDGKIATGIDLEAIARAVAASGR